MAFPLRITIAATFAVLAIVSVSIVAGANYFSGREAARQTADLMIRSSIGLAQNAVERLMIRSTVATESIANLPGELFDWRDPEPLLGTLTVTLRNRPEVYGVFAGFPDGAFVQGLRVRPGEAAGGKAVSPPPFASIAWRVIGPVADGGERQSTWRFFDERGGEIYVDRTRAVRQSAYDPRSRPWFKAAAGQDATVVTPPYVFESLRQPGVTISRAVNGVPGVVVGLDLALGDLSQMAERLKPGRNGVIAILDEGGGIIARSNDDDPGGFLVPATGQIPVVSDVNTPLLHAAVRATAGAEQDFTSIVLAGREYIAARKAAASVGAAEWAIVTVAAMTDFVGELNASLNRSLIVSGLILLTSIAVVAAMAGWISRPVLKLREMADQIARLNLSGVELFKSPFVEIQQLQASMEQMRNALGTSLRFIPQEVVKAQIDFGGIAGVGGERREVTLLFSDIEGFTTISEKMTPEQIMSQVSRYFEQLSIAIQSNRGLIDKFIGDAVMAIWNAPADDEDHVRNAVHAVLTARQCVDDLNRAFAEEGLPVFKTRFGLHSCEALVGNVGAPDRMQYTCLGSGVNLASRIEGLNKFYRTQILISDVVRRRAGETYLFRRVDLVRAKGISRSVTVFELLGERDHNGSFFVGPETVRWATLYEQAFDFYLHRDFDDAIKILEQLRSTLPDDYVVEAMLMKCRNFEADPPPADWDGSTVLDRK